MKKIKLTKGKFALVNDEDFEYLNRWRWYCHSHGYAVRKPKRVIIYMHRLILNIPKGMFTDHKNLNKLDNRRSNLRIANENQNHMNCGLRSNNKSGYKGVWWFFDKRSNWGKWAVAIKFYKKSIHLGYFKTAKEGALAYNEAAVKYFGEFARLNVIK